MKKIFTKKMHEQSFKPKDAFFFPFLMQNAQCNFQEKEKKQTKGFFLIFLLIKKVTTTKA
jgi:hypothetical protein